MGIVERLTDWRLDAEGRIVDHSTIIYRYMWDGVLGDDGTARDQSFKGQL